MPGEEEEWEEVGETVRVAYYAWQRMCGEEMHLIKKTFSKLKIQMKYSPLICGSGWEGDDGGKGWGERIYSSININPIAA